MKTESLLQAKTKAIGPHVDEKNLAYENWEIYSETRSMYTGYHNEQESDWAFAAGLQWNTEDRAALAANGQAPLVFNHLRRIVEQYTSLMAAAAPSWNVVPRLAGSRPMAAIHADILSYIWEQSDGNRVLQEGIRDMITRGTANLRAYWDPYADYGRGDLRFEFLPSSCTYWDVSSRDFLGSDAEYVVWSQLVGKSRLAQKYPEHRKMIEEAAPDHADEDARGHDRFNAWGTKGYAAGDSLKADRDQLRIITRYVKIQQPHIVILDELSGEPVDVVPSNREGEIRDLVASVNAQLRGASATAEEITVRTQEVQLCRIREITSVTTAGRRYKWDRMPERSGVVLADQIMPISRYPIVPLHNPSTHVGNPFPASEVRDIKGVQEFINKMMSLTTKAATGVASGGQWLVHLESGATDEIEEKGNLPNAQINWSGPPELAPTKIPAIPLPEGHFAMIAKAEQIMDSVSGMNAALQGQSDGRESARVRAIRNEEAGRRPDLKVRGLESAISALGRVMLEMSQHVYTDRKVFSISDAAGELRQVVIDSGQNLVDMDGQRLLGNINTGQYHVQVVPDSTKKPQRERIFGEAMELASIGFIDNQAFSQLVDNPILAEAADRMSQAKQAQQTIAQLQKHVSDMERRLEIERNETRRAKERAEVAQFDSALDKQINSIVRSFDKKVGTMETQLRELAAGVQSTVEAERKIAIAEAKSAAGEETLGDVEVNEGPERAAEAGPA